MVSRNLVLPHQRLAVSSGRSKGADRRQGKQRRIFGSQGTASGPALDSNAALNGFDSGGSTTSPPDEEQRRGWFASSIRQDSHYASSVCRRATARLWHRIVRRERLSRPRQAPVRPRTFTFRFFDSLAECTGERVSNTRIIGCCRRRSNRGPAGKFGGGVIERKLFRRGNEGRHDGRVAERSSSHRSGAV